MARTRRTKAAENRAARKEARQYFADQGVKGKSVRFAYHSAKKNEITVRNIDVMSALLRTSKAGSRYIRAMDKLRNDWRTFTIDRIGWVRAA